MVFSAACVLFAGAYSCGGSVATTGPAAGCTDGDAGAASMCNVTTDCPSDLPGAQMIFVPCVDQTAGSCIDATEATRADYQVFLKSNPKPDCSGVCASKQDFAPDAACEATLSGTALDPRAPQACIDWCDADAFCKHEGKHLCIGDAPEVPTATTSQWFNACSKGGQLAFPYGASWDGTRCNVGSLYGNPVPVESYPGCVGGETGLYDMSGNVDEWTGACDESHVGGAACGIAGGSFLDYDQATQCNAGAVETRTFFKNTTGVRCCF